MTGRPVLYLVGCAAQPVLQIAALVRACIGRGWDTCLILTPTADRWLAADRDALAEATGHPIRSAYKLPGQPDVLPPADAVLVAPATSNTINKWAAGISDTLALGLITEAIGKRLPIVTLACLNEAQSAHPAFPRSVATLRAAGVDILLHDDAHSTDAEFPWQRGLDALPNRPHGDE